ncbi:MAG: hypothetical protein H2060_06425 [Azoarcus sp.]|nr:hypothetical protein [Azoarcus sp.]
MSAATDSPRFDARPELALAAVMHLMSRFPARRSPVVADAVVRHLEVIADDARLAEEVRECARQLCSEWASYRTLAAPDHGCAPPRLC